MYGHRFFLKLKSYRLHFCNKKKIEFLIIFDCTLPLSSLPTLFFIQYSNSGPYS